MRARRHISIGIPRRKTAGHCHRRDADMAEFIITIIADVITDIWTLQCLARWRRTRRAPQQTASEQRRD
jgi:hypothetical protein